jgi:hypothetical protein
VPDGKSAADIVKNKYNLIDRRLSLLCVCCGRRASVRRRTCLYAGEHKEGDGEPLPTFPRSPYLE